MSRERRSLWGSIATSNKVNRLSLKAALLYTWAIPHFDDEGFQEGTPKILKTKVVPFRDDIPIEDVKSAQIEILLQKLWKIYYFDGSVFIQDPVFDQRQTFHGIHKEESKIKQLLIKSKTPDMVASNTSDGVKMVQGRCIREVKLSKVKRREVKRRENVENPISFSSFLKSKSEESPSKTLDPISRKHELKKQAQFLKEQDKKT